MKPLHCSIAALIATISIPRAEAALLSYEGFDGGTLVGQPLSAISSGTSAGFATSWNTTAIATNNGSYTIGAGTGTAWSDLDLVSNANLLLSATPGSSLGTATNHSRFIRTLDAAAIAGVSGASSANGEIWVSFMGQRNGTTAGGIELVSTANNRFLETFGGFNTNNWNWSDRATAGTGEVFPVSSLNQAFVSVQLVFGTTSTTIRMFVNRTGNVTDLTNVPSIENVIQNTSNNRPNFDAISVYGGFRIDELRIGTSYADTAPVNTVVAADAGASTWVPGTLTTSGGPLTVNGTRDIAFDGTAATVTVDPAGVTAGSGRIEFRTGGHSITGGNLTSANIVNTAGASSISSIVTARFANIAPASTLTLSEGTLTNGLYGAGSLTKTGTGTLTLSRADVVNADNNTAAQPILTAGRSNYTGTITVSQGTLRFTQNNAAGTGPIIVGDANTGASAAAVGVAATMNLANPITVSANGTGSVTIGSISGAAGNTVISGITTLNRPATITAASTDRTTWTGKITGPVGTLTVAGGQRTVFDNVTNDFVGDVIVTGSNTTLQTGVVSGTEHIPNGSSVTVGGGAFLKFAGVANSNETINALNGAGIVRRHEGVSGLVTLVLGSAGGSGTFSGSLENGAGSLALTKAGAGTQVLAGTSIHSGPTVVNGGTLLVNGSLAATNAVTLGNGTAFGRTVPGTLNIGSLTLGSAAADTAALFTSVNSGGAPSINVGNANGLLANGGAGTVTVNVVGTAPAVGFYPLVDYAGTLGGGFGSFALGTLPNRVTGQLVDNAGNTSVDLQVLTSDSARWSGANGTEWSTSVIAPPKNWVLHSDGTTQTDYLAGDTVNFTDSAVTKTVDVSVADVAPGAVLFSNSTGNDYTLAGSKAVSGAATLTKSGAGKLTISNINAFTGTAALNGGTVSVATVADGGTASPLGGGTTVAFDGGTLEFTGATGGTNRTHTFGASGGTISIAGTLTTSGAFTGTGALTKTGAGTLAINSGSTYAGGTTISAGQVIGSANTSFGTGPITLGDAATGASDVSIYLAQRSDISNPITVSALATGNVTLGANDTGSGANPATFAGLITLNRPVTFSGEVTSDRLAIDGRITGNPGLITIAGGSRTTFLSTLNDFTGDISIVGAGTILQASVATAAETIPNASSVTVGAGAFLQLASNAGGAETIGGLNGTGTVRTFPTSAFGSTLIVGGGNADGTFGGALINGFSPLSLTKSGTGTQTLTGVNTYTGPTNVLDGALVVDGSITGSTTTVNGGTLRGIGTVSALTLAGGTIAPGASPGILNSGNTNLNAGSLGIEINGLTAGAGYDQLNVTGSVSFGGPVQLSLSIGFDPLDGASQSFMILNNDGLDPISFFDSFSGFYSGAAQLAEGSFFTVGGQEFAITYAGGMDANDVVLTAVPEPGSIALLIGGLAFLGTRRTRQRRQGR